MSTSSDDEYYDCYETIRYYAVACQRNRGTGIVTTDINEAKQKIKSIKGSCFKIFYDKNDAKKFAENFVVEDTESSRDKKPKSPKPNVDPFPNATGYELVTFKDAIEAGDEEKCRQIIWNNPRHLVSLSDIPPLLRGLTFRYNALHIAVSANKPKMLSLILDILSNEDLWRTLNPTAGDICNNERRQRVLDMYLNTPDNRNSDTPLHIASKFGYDGCLRALLSQELTDTRVRNREGLMAEEIVCTRYSGTALVSREEKTMDMMDIFSEKFVVLVENSEKMEVLEPLSHCQLLWLLRAANDRYCLLDNNNRNNSIRRQLLSGEDDDVISRHLGCTVRAFVGPLPAHNASKLRGRWAVLNAEDAIKFEEARRKDYEKGLECHGRYLAAIFNAPWKELWSFLDCYTDLGSEEGLSKLEDHLAKVDQQPTAATTMVPSPTAPQSSSPNITSNSNSNSKLYSSLVHLFSRLTLQSPSKPPAPPSPSSSFMSPAAPPQRQQHSRTAGTHNYSLRASKTPFNRSLLGQGLLTPTDRHVSRALLSGSSSRYFQYPRVASYMDSISLLDDFSHNVSSSSLSPRPHTMVTSTPFNNNNNKKKKQQQQQRSHFNTNSSSIKSNALLSSPCLSPFSKIELADD